MPPTLHHVPPEAIGATGLGLGGARVQVRDPAIARPGRCATSLLATTLRGDVVAFRCSRDRLPPSTMSQGSQPRGRSSSTTVTEDHG